MMDKLAKLMAKKKAEGHEMSPLEHKSKMTMLESLRDEMSNLMKEDLASSKGMKKVEVASPDKEGLKLGLDKAKDMLDGSEEGSEGDNAEASEDHEGVESDDQEQAEEQAGEALEPDEDGKEHMDAYHAMPSKENLEKLMAHLARKRAMAK